MTIAEHPVQGHPAQSRRDADALPRVSVIVPCRNEERFIGACLAGILASEYPADLLEILIVDGRSDDRTREIVMAVVRGDPRVRLLDNPRRITPTALNVGIAAATGDVVVRMDAHAQFPPGYIGHLVTALAETGADIVGGSIATRPARDTAVGHAIAIAMQHPFGMGNSAFRIGATGRREVDHVPFFACRRELFQRVGGFDEELVRNQDGEFSWRVRQRGGRVLLVPEARAEYFARDSVGKLARMFFQYGYFKALTASKLRRIVTVRQLIPPMFVLTLALFTSLAYWLPAARLALLTVLVSYGMATVVASLHAGRREPLSRVVALLAVFPTMHVCHGVGQLRRAVELSLGVRPSGRDAVLVPLSR